MSELTPSLDAAPRVALASPSVASPLPTVATAPSTLALRTALAYAAPGAFGAAMALVAAVFLTKFYLDVVLIPAGILALAMAIGRAIDAVVDPVVGYLSDHTHSRWGRRKPWILAGVLGNAVAYYALLTPPESLSPVGTVWWYGTSFMLSFLFVAVSFVPRQALGVELAFQALERQRLYGIAAAFFALGTIVSALMPTLLSSLGVLSQRAQMERTAQIYVAGYLVTNAVFLFVARERADFVGRGKAPFVPGVRRALRNKPFRVMFTSHIITAIPMAMPAVLMPFYVQYVMRLDTLKWTGIYLLAYLTAGFLCLPLWMALTRRIGKRAVWLVLSGITTTGLMGMFFVGEGDTLRMLLLEVYIGTQSASWLFLGGAMHADVVDYDELHTGTRREAQFSALWSMIPKFALIPGAAIPLAVLGSVGYVPNAPTQSDEVLLTLRVLFTLVPLVLNGLGLALMWWYPLTEQRHAAILEGVQQHARGLSADDPITGRRLPPPQQRTVDEATAWFLDFFSRRELIALHTTGKAPLGTVIAKAASFGLLMISAAYAAISRIDRFDVNPGPIPALAIVVSGLSFAGLLFHLLRIRPALKLARAPLASGIVANHLEATR